jgi:hypothetical protein
VTVANTFDVAGRLAEGRPAVADVEEYVAACRRLGYQHPDLTTHPAQVRDWYSGEDGLDLQALESDHGALSAAASVAEDAVRMQSDLLADLDAAWSGRGATAAREFLWRSCQSATAVGAAVRAAADTVATLRDSLWQAVDAKVLATEAVVSEHRAQWLAAAKTVTTGGGDVAAASELVDLQVTPFVDLDVGAGWVAAMRKATSAVDAAYDAAIARITAPVAVFGVPGVLGPRGDRVATEDPTPAPVAAAVAGAGPMPEAASVQTVPAAAIGSAPVPAPAASWSSPEAVALPPPAAAVGAPPMSSAPAAGDFGGTSPMGSMGSMGSGLGGFGQQLADLIGGLVGSGGDLADSAGVDEPVDLDEELDGPAEDEEHEEDENAEEDEGAEEGQEPVVPEEDEGVAEPEEPGKDVADVAAEPAPTTPEPAPTAPPEPTAPPPAVAAQPLAEEAEPTPCEIAADELPQVGQ